MLSIETTLNLEFTGVFGDLDYTGEGSYNFPSSAQDWAGVANVADSFYPLSLPSGGTIKFNGRVPSGGDLDLEFKFERLPYDSEGNAEESTLPSFYTQPITISGNETREYEVTIPPQNVNHTFSSLIMYFRDRNQSAILTDFQILKENIPLLFYYYLIEKFFEINFLTFRVAKKTVCHIFLYMDKKYDFLMIILDLFYFQL